MRLNDRYKEVILESFKDVFDVGEVYLFGSRVDDTKNFFFFA